jgi:hypothetical protein
MARALAATLSLHNMAFLDPIHLWELFPDVAFTLRVQFALIRLIPIARVDRLDMFHTADDFSERGLCVLDSAHNLNRYNIDGQTISEVHKNCVITMIWTIEPELSDLPPMDSFQDRQLLHTQSKSVCYANAFHTLQMPKFPSSYRPVTSRNEHLRRALKRPQWTSHRKPCGILAYTARFLPVLLETGHPL